MRIVVTGGKDFRDENRLYKMLERLHKDNPITELAHGACRGADTLAARWAKFSDVRPVPFEADWGRYKNGAGPIRNRKMLDDFRPDLVVAFPGGTGTWNCMQEADKRGIKVLHG